MNGSPLIEVRTVTTKNAIKVETLILHHIASLKFVLKMNHSKEIINNSRFIDQFNA